MDLWIGTWQPVAVHMILTDEDTIITLQRIIHTPATGSADMSSRVVSNTTGWNLPPSVCPLLTAGRPCISEPSMYERVPKVVSMRW
eukprot:scaffold58986_cov64-Phaeocystis_antarctica.AAC.5